MKLLNLSEPTKMEDSRMMELVFMQLVETVLIEFIQQCLRQVQLVTNIPLTLQ